jgi:hypothetical protein
LLWTVTRLHTRKVRFCLAAGLQEEGGRIWTDGQITLQFRVAGIGPGWHVTCILLKFCSSVRGRIHSVSSVCGLVARDIVHGRTLFPAALYPSPCLSLELSIYHHRNANLGAGLHRLRVVRGQRSRPVAMDVFRGNEGMSECSETSTHQWPRVSSTGPFRQGRHLFAHTCSGPAQLSPHHPTTVKVLLIYLSHTSLSKLS